MVWTTLVIFASAFAADLLSPPGLVAWPLYLVPPALYGHRWSARAIWALASAATVLILFPLPFHAAHSRFPMAVANQFVGVAVLWPVAAYLVRRNRRDSEVVRLRMEMEAIDRLREGELEAANAELRAREEDLWAFFRSAPVMMGIVGVRDGKFHHVSSASTCLPPLIEVAEAGAAPEGEEPRLHPEVSLWREGYRKSRRSGAPVRFEYLHAERGEPRWISAVVSHIGGEAGGRPRFCYVAEDVTERKLAELRLLESENRYRTLVAQLPDVVYMASPEDGGRPYFVSSQLETLLGYRPEEWTSDGSLKARCVHELDRKRVEKEWGFFLSGGAPFASQFRMTARDGRTVWVNEKARIVRDDGGRPSFIQGVVTDISQFKEMERVAFLQEKMVSLGHLAAGLAHEIRNPLSGVNIYLRMAAGVIEEGGGVRPDRREAALNAVRSALAASDKVEEVVKKVLNYSRPGGVQIRKLPMGRVLREAVDFTLIGVRRGNVRIEVDIPEDLPECHVDGRLLEQVIWNLVLNASQAIEETGRKGEIRIAASREGESVVVRVSDSGPGIPGEIRGRLFEPFFTTKESGMGIGLNFCRRVVSDHGGAMEADDSPLGGAEFRFSIPSGDRRRSPRSAG